jgi:hypothetical protein
MSSKSILQFFKPKQQDLLVDSTNVDKRTAVLCNQQLEQLYTSSTESKNKGEISDFIAGRQSRSWTLRYPTFYTKDFEEKKAKYLKEIETLVDKHDIPPQLIINWDHTGIHLVPVSRWIMAEKGSDKVEIIGLDDKRKITGEYFICVQLCENKL